MTTDQQKKELQQTIRQIRSYRDSLYYSLGVSKEAHRLVQTDGVASNIKAILDVWYDQQIELLTEKLNELDQ